MIPQETGCGEVWTWNGHTKRSFSHEVIKIPHQQYTSALSYRYWNRMPPIQASVCKPGT